MKIVEKKEKRVIFVKKKEKRKKKEKEGKKRKKRVRWTPCPHPWRVTKWLI